MIFISFGANASQICKINYSDIAYFVSMKEKYNHVAQILKSKSKAEQARYDKFNQTVRTKLIIYDLEDVIYKKCKYGDVILLHFFHSERHIERDESNPVWLEHNFNELIARVCDREKRINQYVKEANFSDKRKGITTFLDCIYNKKKSDRDHLKHYGDK
jgi:hypothetical protein